MSKIYTSEQDEVVVRTIQSKGLRAPDSDPKWKVLRIGLAISLKLDEPPGEIYDDFRPKKGEYALKALCGEGQDPDYTDAYRALLSVYHDCDLFADEVNFVRLLQRHIRRGLAEISRGWRGSHDFHEFLYQELFSRIEDSRQTISADLSEPLLAALRENGIAAEIREMRDGPRLQSYETLLHDATQLRILQRALENIAFALGKGPVSLMLGSEPRQADILIPKQKSAWRIVEWGAMLSHLHEVKQAALGVVIGVDPLGVPVTFDLAKTPHLLVGGTTGSGKSVVLNALIVSLLTIHDAASVSLCLIDPKQAEFAAYRDLPQLWGGEPIIDPSRALAVLEDITHEMERREGEMARLGFKQLAEWRLARPEAPPYLVVFVEELADMILQRPEVEAPIVRLAQKGRASGIHLVLATQRPDSVTFSGLLRSNIPSRIALTVQKASESRIILDDTGAELLLGQGDMLLKLVGEPARRVHGVRIDSSDITTAISRHRN